MSIILYDIPSRALGCAWSPNVWKVRYCLNYKQIPHKTEWVEYPDIEKRCKALGILPTSTSDGRDLYTLPAIHDPSTGAYVSDSFRIAEYLEKTYPDTPKIFPDNTHGLQAAFLAAFEATMRSSDSATRTFILVSEFKILNPVSQEYFRETREKRFGKTFEELEPPTEEVAALWARYQKTLDKIDAWYAKTDNGEAEKTPYLMENRISWADCVMGGYTVWLKILWGEDSQLWKDLMSWHGGRWKNLMEGLQKYATIN